MCIAVKKYKFQYKNKSFGTEKYFLKKLEKIGRYFIYDYYYVPKYMLIIVYLNKPYIFHYYKLSRLYSSKLQWPTTATHQYILYYCILYLSTQTYSLAVRVYLPVQ